MKWLTVFALGALVAVSKVARADGADTLLDEGRALLDKGEIAAACEKFHASEALRPSGTALLNLADCYERNGQYASAHDRFVEAADRALAAGRSELESVARKRARDLDARVSTLKVRFTVPPPAGTILKRDGAEIPESAWSVPAPVDPGMHHIVVSAPGCESISIDVDVARERSAPEVIVPALAKKIVVTPSVPATPSKAQRTIGLAVGGVGAAGVLVGGVLGIAAIVRHADVTAACPSNVCPSTDAMNRVAGANADSQAFALGSTVTFIAGAVLATVGLTLVLTSPKRTVVVGFGSITGSF